MQTRAIFRILGEMEFLNKNLFSMKKQFVLALCMLIGMNLLAYEWEPYGPESIDAYKIHVFENDFATAIFVESGFYLSYHYYNPNWEYYDFPASGAASYNADTILLILNEGTYSDGIYILDVNTQTITVMEYCVEPNYIAKVPDEPHYFVGHEYGMLESIGGLVWTEVSYLNDCRCIDMAVKSDKYAVACDMMEDNVFISNDGGLIWEQIIDWNKYTELDIVGHYSLYSIIGICQESFEPGLYELAENEWEVLYPSHDISALGSDNSDSPIIGWNQGNPPDIGIARYKMNPPNVGLSYFNEGLPDLNIIDIAEGDPGIFGSIWIFCVTESGVFVCKNVTLSSEARVNEGLAIELFPNPTSTKITIQMLGETNVTASASFYDVTGNILMMEAISAPSCQVDISSFSAGVYYVQIVDAHDRVIGSQKIVKQ